MSDLQLVCEEFDDLAVLVGLVAEVDASVSTDRTTRVRLERGDVRVQSSWLRSESAPVVTIWVERGRPDNVVDITSRLPLSTAAWRADLPA